MNNLTVSGQTPVFKEELVTLELGAEEDVTLEPNSEFS